MKAFARLAAFFGAEVRLHLCHWRFWFSLLLLTGLGAATILRAGKGAQSVVDLAPLALPLLWAVGAVILLVGVETAAECRRPGLAPILWTKPFSSLTYALARQAALFAVIAPLLVAPFALHWAAVRLLWGQACSFEPSFWLIVYWAWPAALLLSSMAVWSRTVFDHDVSALGAAAGLAWGALYLNARLHLGLAGFDKELTDPLLAPCHPTVGRDLFHPPYLWAVGRTAAFAAFFTVLSACHLRRIEPKPIPISPWRLVGLPTFRRQWERLKIDPSPGAEVIGALLLAAGLVLGISAKRFADSRAHEALLQRWAVAMKEALPKRAAPGPSLKMTRVEADIRLLGRERVDVRAAIEAVNPQQEPKETALFALCPTLELHSVKDAQDRPVSFERFGEFLEVRFASPLAPLTTETLRFHCSGRPIKLTVGGRNPATGLYEAASEPIRFASRFPTLHSGDLLPVPAAMAGPNEEGAVRRSPSPAVHDLRVRLCGGLRAFCPEGEARQERLPGGEEATRIEVRAPVTEVEILAGPYEWFDGVYGGLPVRVHCFPQDREILEAVCLLTSPQFSRIIKVLGLPPEGRLSFIETVAPSREPIPMRTIPSEMAWALKLHESDFQESRQVGLTVYQASVNQLCRLAMGTYFASRLRFAPPISAMRRGLYNLLREDLKIDSIDLSALRSARIFEETAPHNRGLMSHSDLRLFQAPFAAAAARSDVPRNPDSPDRERVATLIWRMVRYVLGDEAFCALTHDLMATAEAISPERLQLLAEARYGKPLDWFFAHWLHGVGIPRYEILRAEARMVENDSTRQVDYDVRVSVANRGRGLMPAPVVVQSERDTVIRPMWLDSGSSDTLRLVMPYRPEYVVVDPEGWIAQEAQWRAESKSRGRPLRPVDIFEE